MSLRRLATPNPWNTPMSTKSDKLNATMEEIEEDEEKTSCEESSPVVRDLLSDGEATTQLASNEENQEKDDVQPAAVNTDASIEASEHSNPTTTADAVITSRTTTADSAHPSLNDEKPPTDLKTALSRFVVACARGVAAQLPDSIHSAADAFIDDPIDASKTYSSMALQRLKNIDLDDIRGVAAWTHRQVSALIAKLPIKETLQYLQEKSHELALVAVPMAQKAFKNARISCQNQIDQYCERRREDNKEDDKKEH